MDMIKRVLLPFFTLLLLLCTVSVTVSAQAAASAAGAAESEKVYYAVDRAQQLAYPLDAGSEAARILGSLKPAKEEANTAYPVRAAFLEKQKDGGKRLLYVTNSQIYEAVSGQCYESAPHQRTRLSELFTAHKGRQSGGTPFWLAYMSPQKLTKIYYRAEYWGNWLDDSPQTHGDNYEVELFPASEHEEEYEWTLRQLSKFSNCTMEKQYDIDVLPMEGYHMIELRFDTGVFYRMFITNKGFYIFASDLDRTVDYATTDSDVQYELVTYLNSCAKEFGVYEDMPDAGL